MDKAIVAPLGEVHLLRAPGQSGKQPDGKALERNERGTSAMLPSTIPNASGHIGLYRQGGAMRCPDCGQSQWLIGRVMAECACCEAALPLGLGYRAWLDISNAPPRSLRI
jgi:hypothetical protein